MGQFVILPSLSKALRCEEPLIAIIGTISTIFCFLIMATGQKDWTGPNGTWDPSWVMFVSAAFQWDDLIYVSIISQVTKIFEKSELGKVLSIITLVRCFVRLIPSPMYGEVYKATLDTYEGTYLLVAVTLFSCMIGNNLYILLRLNNGEYEKIENGAEEN